MNLIGEYFDDVCVRLCGSQADSVIFHTTFQTLNHSYLCLSEWERPLMCSECIHTQTGSDGLNKYKLLLKEFSPES